jgi:hypothetical protein
MLNDEGWRIKLFIFPHSSFIILLRLQGLSQGATSQPTKEGRLVPAWLPK